MRRRHARATCALVARQTRGRQPNPSGDDGDVVVGKCQWRAPPQRIARQLSTRACAHVEQEPQRRRHDPASPQRASERAPHARYRMPSIALHKKSAECESAASGWRIKATATVRGDQLTRKANRLRRWSHYLRGRLLRHGLHLICRCQGFHKAVDCRAVRDSVGPLQMHPRLHSGLLVAATLFQLKR